MKAYIHIDIKFRIFGQDIGHTAKDIVLPIVPTFLPVKTQIYHEHGVTLTYEVK